MIRARRSVVYPAAAHAVGHLGVEQAVVDAPVALGWFAAVAGPVGGVVLGAAGGHPGVHQAATGSDHQPLWVELEN